MNKKMFEKINETMLEKVLKNGSPFNKSFKSSFYFFQHTFIFYEHFHLLTLLKKFSCPHTDNQQLGTIILCKKMSFFHPIVYNIFGQLKFTIFTFCGHCKLI